MTEPMPDTPSLPATTTHQEDVTTAGQRKINLIWEVTQSSIAIAVTVTCMIVSVYLAVSKVGGDFPPFLSNSAFLILGFYFSRTNHQAIGGVGTKANENQPYTGR